VDEKFDVVGDAELQSHLDAVEVDSEVVAVEAEGVLETPEI
jgi:hypothetical protein